MVAPAAYYIAMRDTTPFASFLPLNGFIMVLRNDRLIAGDLFPNNLLNKPLFVVNGGRDPLYPTSVVEPVHRASEEGRRRMSSIARSQRGHDTPWWPGSKTRSKRSSASIRAIRSRIG